MALVGYRRRHYDAAGVEPLFPFGHGLTYTRLRYEDLAVRSHRSGLTVTFTVRNTGRVAGDEVPQVYLTPPADAPVVMAPQTLAGFERITLRPGGRRRVTIEVGRRALSYWSEAEGRFVVAVGRRTVLVGSSSRDVRLRKSVTVS